MTKTLLLSAALLAAACAPLHAATTATAGTTAAGTAPTTATAPGGESLIVDVAGVRSDEGQIIVSLCREGESFPGRCTKRAKAKAQQGTTRVTFDNLAPGKYAAAVFHDADGDGKLTFLKEGIGFSNNANLAFSEPKFEPSSFAVAGKTTVRLTLKYFN